MRGDFIMEEKVANLIKELKALPIHIEIIEDDGGVMTLAIEFPEAFEYAKTLDASKKALVHSMKGWAEALSSEFNRWKKGRDNEIPYLLKILVSSEEELLSCLK